MANLFEILAGIVATDNPAATLADDDAIVNYAEFSGDPIDYAQAARIAAVGKVWLHEQENGNGEWSRMRHDAERALSDD